MVRATLRRAHTRGSRRRLRLAVRTDQATAQEINKTLARGSSGGPKAAIRLRFLGCCSMDATRRTTTNLSAKGSALQEKLNPDLREGHQHCTLSTLVLYTFAACWHKSPGPWRKKWGEREAGRTVSAPRRATSFSYTHLGEDDGCQIFSCNLCAWCAFLRRFLFLKFMVFPPFFPICLVDLKVCFFSLSPARPKLRYSLHISFSASVSYLLALRSSTGVLQDTQNEKYKRWHT